MALDFLHLPEDSSIRIPHQAIHAQIVSILESVGAKQHHAQVTADALTLASLRGVDTHGVTNIVRYTEAILDETYTCPQNIEILSESDTTALITCDNGLGFPAAHEGMQIAMQKASKHGLGMTTIRDGHHIGMVAYYAMLALEKDMIGIAMTNAGPAVRPALARKPMLGTNPIAFAAPAEKENNFILDMATSTVASGKIGLARRLGVPIPEGWAVGAEGEPITEPPGDRGDHWAQNPLGNTREQGAHKGYGLAVMVDILCGVLSGGGYSSMIGSGRNMSWTMAIDIASFRPVNEFKDMMDQMIQDLHETPAEAGVEAVLIAGDPEEEAKQDREANGIPILKTQYEDIRRIAEQVGAELVI